MKKLFILGQSPLPGDEKGVRAAAGLRTYQFLKPLLEEKLWKICLVTVEPELTGNTPIEECEHHILWKNDPQLINKLQTIHNDFAPTVLLGVNTYPSYLLSRLNTKAPFWADLNGWILAEAQAQAFSLQSDVYWPHYLEMQASILKKADHFSTVSKAQAQALIGELAWAGRLGFRNFGFDLVSPVPNATEFFEGENQEKAFFPALSHLPEKAFKILWIGGYNTWVDENLLFESLEELMSRYSDLYFISTGGAIPGLSEGVFERFQKKISNSKYSARFIFLGWVEQEALPSLYALADLGINVDRDCVETRTGARNRINEMLKFGLPVVSTAGSEVAEQMSQAGAGIQVFERNPRAFSKAVEALLIDPEQRRNLAKAGRQFTESHSYKKMIQVFLDWMEDPKTAPDRGFLLKSGGRFAMALHYLKDRGLSTFLKKLWQKIKA